MPSLQDTVGAAVQEPASVGIDWGQLLVGWLDLASVATHLLQVLAILVLAGIADRMLRFLTRRLQREVDEPDPVRKRQREQRLQTTASLLNYIGRVAIAIGAVLMILGLFIPIGPLLAGAGVLGLAVSFGAQSLVKDLIAGGFMLVEGQFAVGDVVRIGETAGMVEKITLRTTVLRDLHGVVHIVPNGTIETLSNLTKSFSKAVLDIGVAYKEDVDRVIEVMREEALLLMHDEGSSLKQDETWAAMIMEEPQVLGVQDFGDSAVVIRIAFKTLPLRQWDVAREYRRRLKNRFDREGIEIPFPHRTVYWGEDQMPTAEPAP